LWEIWLEDNRITSITALNNKYIYGGINIANNLIQDLDGVNENVTENIDLSGNPVYEKLKDERNEKRELKN